MSTFYTDHLCFEAEGDEDLLEQLRLPGGRAMTEQVGKGRGGRGYPHAATDRRSTAISNISHRADIQTPCRG